jgi:hypothetical protein
VNIPRWSQGHTNLCYAYSAASLIDYYRLTKGDKDQTHITSPLLLSLKTIENYQDVGSTFSGGKIEHAFATAKMYGSCGIQAISDQMGSSSTDLILTSLSQFYQDTRKSPEQVSDIAKKIRQFFQDSKIKIEKLPELSEIERSLSLSESQFKINLLMKYCGDVKKLEALPDPKFLFQPDVSADEVSQQLQNILSLGTPVGINFCANVVTDPQHQGRMSADNKWICKDSKNHSAIVVGRKYMDGKCSYLVRDTGCDGYSEDPSRCDRGQYWLDTTLLTQNLHGIFWLE